MLFYQKKMIGHFSVAAKLKAAWASPSDAAPEYNKIQNFGPQKILKIFKNENTFTEVSNDTAIVVLSTF